MDLLLCISSISLAATQKFYIIWVVNLQFSCIELLLQLKFQQLCSILQWPLIAFYPSAFECWFDIQHLCIAIPFLYVTSYCGSAWPTIPRLVFELKLFLYLDPKCPQTQRILASMCSVQCVLIQILHLTSLLTVSKPQQVRFLCSRCLLRHFFMWIMSIFVPILVFKSKSP